MHDEAFARMVAEEVKNKVNPLQADYLRLPENWGRWQRALQALAANLADQSAAIDAAERRDVERFRALGPDGLRLLAEAIASHEDKRKRIQRFAFYVDARLDEVTRMISMGTSALDNGLRAADFLRRAIERHAELVTLSGRAITPDDRALWAALDGTWAFDDTHATR